MYTDVDSVADHDAEDDCADDKCNVVSIMMMMLLRWQWL